MSPSFDGSVPNVGVRGAAAHLYKGTGVFVMKRRQATRVFVMKRRQATRVFVMKGEHTTRGHAKKID